MLFATVNARLCRRFHSFFVKKPTWRRQNCRTPSFRTSVHKPTGDLNMNVHFLYTVHGFIPTFKRPSLSINSQTCIIKCNFHLSFKAFSGMVTYRYTVILIVNPFLCITDLSVDVRGSCEKVRDLFCTERAQCVQ